MSDKASVMEAVKSIKRRNRLVKKSIAGIGRTFPIPDEPKALTVKETGFSSALPAKTGPVRRKLRPPKTQEVVEQVIEALREEEKDDDKELKELQKDLPKFKEFKFKKEPKASNRVKRNTMPIFLP